VPNTGAFFVVCQSLLPAVSELVDLFTEAVEKKTKLRGLIGHIDSITSELCNDHVWDLHSNDKWPVIFFHWNTS
jgi:hypothetical protein